MISYEERCEEGARMLYGAHVLAEKSNVPFAHAIDRFLAPGSTSVSQPISKGGNWGLSNKLSMNSVSITPLFEEDTGVHPYFDSLIEQRTLRYEESMHSIYMPAKVFSMNVGGLVLLHEGIHAYAHAKNLWRNMPGNWSHWLEEVNAFKHELSVVHAIAGKPFERSVIKYSTIFTERIRNRELNAIYVSSSDVEPTLEKMTKEQYADDTGLMSTLIGIGAVFHSLSGGFKFSDKSLASSANFLRWLNGAPNDPMPIPEMHMPRELI